MSEHRRPLLQNSSGWQSGNRIAVITVIIYITFMNILFVAAEVAPFSSVGGLSQVMHFLPKALLKMGHDVRIWSAKYGVIDGSGGSMPVKKKWPMKLEMEGLIVPTGLPPGNPRAFLRCNVKSSQASRRDPLVYFLENREYYELRAHVYQYADDHIRFALLSKGCLEWLLHQRSTTGSTGTTSITSENQENFSSARGTRGTFGTRDTSDVWFPDLIHCNDWHTSHIAEYLKTDLRYRKILGHIPILLTVHNFGHQGNGAFDFRFQAPEKRDRGDDPLPHFFSPSLIEKNILVRGIKYADAVNTVSKTYADEALTPEYGDGIDDVLVQYKEKLTGILNGLDTTEFNPMTDPLIASHFSPRSLNRRAENKAALQREFKLPRRPELPLLAVAGRMDRQKGIDLMMKAVPHLLGDQEFQLVVLGGGDEILRSFFQKLAADYPDRVSVYLQPNFTLPRKIFSGADLLLMPSKFEPGGIVAMEALRYGCVPLVRRTGGLNDIVTDFQPTAGIGNGFSFQSYDPWSFYGAVVTALTTYRDRERWRHLVMNCLREDFSWDHAAKEYEALYQSLLKEV